ncbi:MAG: copper-binding protein [Pseudomonadota bacterium]
MKAISKLALTIVMAAAGAFASAQEGAHAGHGGHQGHTSHAGHAGHQAASPADLTEGEVRKVDKETGKLTLRHGEIRNLNMAAMTMVLRVQDPAILEQVKVGDKVRFAADRINGAVTIVQLEKAL